MAEERIAEIVIPIRYEYQNKGLKQVAEDLEKVTDVRTLNSSKKSFSALRAEFQKLSGSFSIDDKKINSAYNKVQKQIDATIKKQQEYNRATKEASSFFGFTKGGKKHIGAKEIAEQDARKRLDKATADFANDDITKEDYALEVEKYYQKLYDLEIKGQKLTEDKANKQIEYRQAVSATSTEFQELVRLQDQLGKSDANKALAQSAKELAEKQKEAAEAAKKAAKEQEEYKKKVKSAVDTLRSSFKKLPQSIKSGIQSLAATLYVLRRIFTFLKRLGSEINNLISASSKWIENLNLLEVVFGDVSKNAESTKKWVSDLARTFSMDKNAIVQYVSTFKQMANAMGQASAVGEQMSEVLTQLGLDISSLRNVKTETAMSDLASAIAGQIKPVRKYGFDITQQSIAALLKETGIGGTTAGLSQADKQLARTILLIRQSKDAWGDLAKTINTFANQERILNDQFETTKRLIGQIFLGTFQFGQKLEEAEKTAGVATQIIWHLNSVVIAFNDVLEAILPTADSVNGAIASLAEDTQEDIEETEEALENSLASFDKFNVMASGKSGATTQNNATLEGVFTKEAAQYLEEFDKRSKDIVSYARELADELLRKLFPEFDKWAGNSKKTFKEWLEDVDGAKNSVLAMIEPVTELAKTVKDVIMQGINDIPNILAASSNLLNGMIRVIQPIVKFVADILANIGADGVVKWIKAIFWLVVSFKALGFLGSVVINLGKIISSLTTILPLIGKIYNTIKMTLATGSGATLTAVTVGLGALLAGMILFVSLKDKMTSTARAITVALAAMLAILVGIVTTIVAIKSMHLTPVVAIGRGIAAATAVAGVTLAMGATFGSIANKHAQGGYQTGGLFYAGESGAEWVGRQGNTSTIVNDKQMSDIMQQSVALGVVQGNRMAGGASGNGSNKVAVVNLDGRRLFEVVQENGKRVGKVFAEA